jgi:hypothetical protein
MGYILFHTQIGRYIQFGSEEINTLFFTVVPDSWRITTQNLTFALLRLPSPRIGANNSSMKCCVHWTGVRGQIFQNVMV